MRLAFAVAAHLDPEILLVDEVLAVGDAAFQKKCLGKMHEVATEGRTVLFVSHNMHAIEQMCSSAVCFVPGQPPRLQRDTRAVIGEYLFGANRQGLSATIWTNSGGQFSNRWFTPMAFRLTDRSGRPLAQPATNADDMWVDIEGEIESVDPGLWSATRCTRRRACSSTARITPTDRTRGGPHSAEAVWCCADASRRTS